MLDAKHMSVNNSREEKTTATQVCALPPPTQNVLRALIRQDYEVISVSD